MDSKVGEQNFFR